MVVVVAAAALALALALVVVVLVLGVAVAVVVAAVAAEVVAQFSAVGAVEDIRAAPLMAVSSTEEADNASLLLLSFLLSTALPSSPIPFSFRCRVRSASIMSVYLI